MHLHILGGLHHHGTGGCYPKEPRTWGLGLRAQNLAQTDITRTTEVLRHWELETLGLRLGGGSELL